jgi:hypothetical protein
MTMHFIDVKTKTGRVISFPKESIIYIERHELGHAIIKLMGVEQPLALYKDFYEFIKDLSFK